MAKNIFRPVKLFLIGFMLAICIVMGVAIVIPKRKEETGIEIKMVEQEQNKDTIADIKGIETRE
jgi:hypothetical protein